MVHGPVIFLKLAKARPATFSPLNLQAAGLWGVVPAVGAVGSDELRYRPICLCRIIGRGIEKHVCVDEYHGSSRVSSIIASVSSPSPACPAVWKSGRAAAFGVVDENDAPILRAAEINLAPRNNSQEVAH